MVKSARSRGTANNNAIELGGARKEPEHNLWTAVLAKAADDALFTTNYREALLAINWFENEGVDFKRVCQYAGRNHEYVSRKILKQVRERKRKIKEWEEGIRQRIEGGMARKMALWSLQKRGKGREKGRKHKGGYHSAGPRIEI
ncbi:MAG: hypothetical protein CL508_00040 [Actinobacteria bacterium]|nr:hypothetical protein [Actinomycetota bacterium]|tara:strand:+ start:2629 stop:3060 length:432 start_codon:yes stop_codon:yes gene_type:complete